MNKKTNIKQKTNASKHDKWKKLEFHKKIVVWAMLVTTIFLVIATGGWYIKEIDPPSSLVDMVVVIITGVIISYAGKAGIENYQKIKNSLNQVSNIETTEEEEV